MTRVGVRSAFLLCLLSTIIKSKNLPENQIDNSLYSDVNVLNLHYDHCKRPKTFSWATLKCECPPPLIEVKGGCGCDKCFNEDTKHGYLEGKRENLPNFINEVFEEVHDEIENIKGNGQNDTEDWYLEKAKENDDDPSKMSNVANNQLSYQENATHSTPTIIIENTNEDKNESGVEYRFLDPEAKEFKTSISTYDKEPDSFFRQKKPLGNYEGKSPKKKHNQTVITLTGRRTMDVNFLEVKKEFVPSQPTTQKVISRTLDMKNFKYFKLKFGDKIQSYSESVVGGYKSGKVSTGMDKAKGFVSAPKGTGALSLATGSGSAAGSAFTGFGESMITANAKGTFASGFSLVGKDAKKGVSTTSLLLGTGDVITVNSLGARGSASGAGVTTKKTAGAATSAYGPASASITAAVGKGAARSSTSFNKTLSTEAGVERQGGAVVESSAVGNPNQDISNINGEEPDFVKIPQEFLPHPEDNNIVPFVEKL